jgi:drug/metabolite transporter (DMT)-like permease
VHSVTPRDRIDLNGVLLMVLLTFLWGCNYSAIKFASDGISPVFMSFLRSAIASLLGILYCVAIKEPLFHRDIRLWHGCMVGFLFGIEFACIYFGLRYTHAARAGILINLSPFVVVIGAYLFLKERLNTLKITGLCLAFAGAGCVLLWGKPATWTPAMLFGDALEVIAAVLWGATTIYIKKYLAGKVQPIHTFLYQLVFSIPILLLCAYVLEPTWIHSVNGPVLAALGYQSVIVAFASYLAWFKLIHTYPVSQLAVYSFLTPIFGVASGAIFLGEPITAGLVIGMSLVCAGIYVNSVGQR